MPLRAEHLGARRGVSAPLALVGAALTLSSRAAAQADPAAFERARVRDLAAGCRVLDVFACTGGFSLHAAAGGAINVNSVDLSRRSLATAGANFVHNATNPAVAAARHTTTVGDAFDVMEHRKHFNDLTCVMLLSDGQDTCGNRQEDFAPFLKE